MRAGGDRHVMGDDDHGSSVLVQLVEEGDDLSARLLIQLAGRTRQEESAAGRA